MLAKTLLATGAAASLLAGAAYAQRTFPPHVDMPIAAQTGVLPSATNLGDAAVPMNPLAEAPAATPQAADVAAIAPETAAQPPIEVVASPPVPDTPATRSLYPPLSRAGRLTEPRGN